ncbi:hypothetical protein F5Y04DRAFT_210840 [Hypomontagnella monticulosa]|nr:hypothetical protein F5Y04DRAFT_210840 [Hypomontagnella monticulosa]
MVMSFLEYLTLPNPEPDSSQCKEGYSSKSSYLYRPDDVQPWKDLTLESLEMNYKDILRQPMDEPRVRNAREISPEKARLYEESSIQALAAYWNEEVVQHVLNGTRSILHQKLPDGPFNDGKIYFTRNLGQAHIKDGKGIYQRPDWCLYQQKGVAKTKRHKNLLPGDIKPAKKWKSEWINSSKETEKRKANLVLAQIAKYMFLGNTRYGFVLSEEELVAMRLSKFTRDTQSLDELAQTDTELAKQLMESTWGLERDPDGSYGDTERRTGILLEYCRIPWDASGTGSFTVNLTLWWLSVLAVQGAPIKQAGLYTPLHAKTRGDSPAWTDTADSKPSQEPRSTKSRTRPKRKAPEMLEATTITMNHSSRTNPNNTTVSSRNRSSKTRAQTTSKRKQTGNEEQMNPGQSFTSNASSHASKRPRRQRSAAYYADSSDGESSQATNEAHFSFYQS